MITTPPPQIKLPAAGGPPGSRKTPDRPCLNCGDPTPGNYCPGCGQRKVEVRVTLRRMVLDAIDDEFSLNSALPRTVAALLLRPGHLTREYMNGRIARYIPPFRLYLVSSIAFFLILSFQLGGSAGPGKPGGMVQMDTAGLAAMARDSAGQRRNWAQELDVNLGVAEVDSVVRARLLELGEMEPDVAFRRVGDQFLDYVPQTMFLLLPVFAGILKLLYLRRGRLYVEHFIFALHLHAFIFVCFGIEALVDSPPVEVALTLWIVLYGYLAMYRVYGQGWLRTAVKYGALSASYTVLMSLAMLATLIAALLIR